MADLSQFTDQERALLAQYLALKAGGVGNAPALVQMVLDRLASGQYGSTLTEVIAGLIPEGIPLGTDFSEYADFVNTGAVPAPTPPAPQAYYDNGGESSSSESPFEAFGPQSTGTLFGGKKPGVPATPAATAPTAALDPDTHGIFGPPMSPAIPPQGPPPPEMELSPLHPAAPALPRRDPRVASLAPSGPLGGDLGSVPAAPELAKPAPQLPETAPGPAGTQDRYLAPPALPPLDARYTPDGWTGPDPAAERLVTPLPALDPTAPQEPFKYVSPSTFPARPSFPASNAAPTPLVTRPVTTQPINPTTGMPVDFAGLKRNALIRDLAGPLDYGPIDTGISALSGLAAAQQSHPTPTASQPRPGRLSDEFAPSAPSSPSTFPARPEVPGALPAAPDPFYIPPIEKPALTEQVLEDWIDQQGLRNPVGPISLDFSTLPLLGASAQQAADTAAQRMRSPPASINASTEGTPANAVYQPTPAPLPAARMAVAAALPEHMIDLTDDEREYLARAVATEVDPRVASMDPAAYQLQVYRVMDTMLNREASGQFGEFDDLASVLNQNHQFSAIAGPKSKKGERYGSVEAIPAERASPELRKMINDWIGQRQTGTPSSVGGALHFANPNAADKSNMNWINALDGPQDTLGPFGHKYGTTPGFKPVEAVLRNPALSAANQQARGAGWLSTQPQTPISTTGALTAEKRGAKHALGPSFDAAIQSAAQQQRSRTQGAAKVAQVYTPPATGGSGTDGPFNYDKSAGKAENTYTGGDSPSSKSLFETSGPQPTTPKTTNTPKATAPTKTTTFTPAKTTNAPKTTTTAAKNTTSYTSGTSSAKTTNSSSDKKNKN